MPIFINNFNDFIKSRKGMSVVSSKKGLARGGKVAPFFIPPCNTNPNLSKLKSQKIKKKKLARAIAIPPIYDLCQDPKYAGRIIIPGDRAVEATSQFMQYTCGSCWAYAVATSVSDAFVVTRNLAYNPRLSWTYLLGCFPSMANPGLDENIPPSAQCGGGDIASTLSWIATNGIASNRCVDYSWCVSSAECTGSSSDADALNKLIPSCGCYKKGSYQKYKIKNVNSLRLDDNSTDDQILIFRNLIRTHILMYGSVIGALILLTNVVDRNPSSNIAGDFKTAKNPQGVYLECVGVGEGISTTLPSVEKATDQCVIDPAAGTSSPVSILGGHAISVVGWGVAPVHQSLISPDLRAKFPPDASGMIEVPYWRIRNSWGDKYADRGFYNHAMYPFNKVSQIDKTVKITDPATNGVILVGGCVVFEPDTVESTDSLPQNDGKGMAAAGSTSAGSDVNTGLFPGSSASSPSSSSSSSKIAFAPLYGDPPEPAIPIFTGSTADLSVTTTTPPPTEMIYASTMSPVAPQSPSRVGVIVGVIAGLLLLGGLIAGGYWYYRKIHTTTIPFVPPPIATSSVMTPQVAPLSTTSISTTIPQPTATNAW